MTANPFWTATNAAGERALSSWQHSAGSTGLAASAIGGVSVGGFVDTQPGKLISDFVTFQAIAGDTYDVAVGSPAGASVAVFDDSGFLQSASSITLAGYAAQAITADHSGTFRVQVVGIGIAGTLVAQAQPSVTVDTVTAQLAPVVTAAFSPHAGVSQAELALIDVGYYLATNLDVLAAVTDPIAHFTAHGAFEGRKPDAVFDPAFYLAHNPDVASAGIDPLAHYAQFGWREGRDPSATFSASGYLAHNADVRLAGMNPLAHYIDFGIVEGRAAS